MTMSLIATGTRSWRRCNWGDDVPRVLTARFMHESNTFSRVKTDMALIRRRDISKTRSRRRFAALAPHSALPSRQRTNTADPRSSGLGQHELLKGHVPAHSVGR